MAADNRNARGTRPRGSRIEVWGSPEERAAIAAKADQSGLSQSAFLRAVGLNQPVRSIYDLKAAADFIRVNGDASRLAGLLKDWMTDHPGGGPPQEIEAMIQDLRLLQDEMHRIAGCVIRCQRACRATRLRDR